MLISFNQLSNHVAGRKYILDQSRRSAAVGFAAIQIAFYLGGSIAAMADKIPYIAGGGP